MSKFFADESDESSDHDSVQSDQEKQKIQDQDRKNKMNKRQQIMEEIESSEEEAKHVVVSEKDKRVKHMREMIERIRNKQKINDFVGMQNEFEELNKELEKGRKMFEKEGGIPRFYIRVICQLENFLLGIQAEDKKKFSQTNNKAYNTMKQRIKKHNLGFKAEIDEFLKNPVDSEVEKKMEREKLIQQKKEKQTVDKQESEDEEDEDDDDEDEVAEESEEEKDDDDKYLLQSNDPMVRRRYWLLKEEVVQEKEEDDRVERQKLRLEKKKQENTQIDYEMKFQIQNPDEIQIDLGENAILKTLQKIVESRGRSGGQHQNLYICEKLIQHFISKGDLKMALEILIITVQLQIDQAKSEGTLFIARRAWHQIYQNILQVVSLSQDQGLKFDSLNTFSKYDSSFSRQKFLDTVQLNFSTLDSELNKSFFGLEFNVPEYSERLSDLYQLIFLAQKLLNMFQKENDTNNSAKISYKYMELIYFLSQPLVDKIKTSPFEDTSTFKYALAKPQVIFSEPLVDISAKLIKFIYAGGDEEQVKRATLYYVYNLSLHGRYQQARDLLQLTFTNDSITVQKLTMQVHYNRAIVMLGLAAFRQGLILDAHSLLGEFIITRDRLIRDLLAQNYTRAASETEAVKYNVAYHLSINLEMVETIYYVCAMLLEIPNINHDYLEDQQKVISKKFRLFYTHYEPQPFNNINDNFREIIYAASKHLSVGNWKDCYNSLLNLQIWTKIHNCDEVQAKIFLRIKEQALKCYLLNFKSAIACINIQDLTNYFEMDFDLVKSIVFRMIYYRELNAKIQGGDTLKIVFKKAAENALDRNALALIEKINILAKTNEKILDAKYGSYGFQQTEKEGGDYNKTQKAKSKKKTTQKFKSKNLTKPKRV